MADDFELEITKIIRRSSGGGTWVCGTIDDYRFEALVFPEHAVYESYEIGKSRISKLWIRREGEKRAAYHWDRGLDVPARTKKVRRSGGTSLRPIKVLSASLVSNAAGDCSVVRSVPTGGAHCASYRYKKAVMAYH